VIGNALGLPFEDSSFQAVVNVESSGSYPDWEKFFREVFRVLTPGGSFCYADNARLPGTVEDTSVKLTDLGFILRTQSDITKNVALALKLGAEDLKDFFSNMVRKGTAKEELVAEMYRLLRTVVYREYSNRVRVYWSMHLSKPD